MPAANVAGMLFSAMWKQPIDTICLNWDTLSRAIFCELMLHARNEDGNIPPFWHGNKFYANVFLKRGQTIFVAERFAREIGQPLGLKSINGHKVRIFLKGLINLGINIEINRKAFGLVVTIKNYDELVGFVNQSINQSINQSEINRKSIVRPVTRVVKSAKDIESDSALALSEEQAQDLCDKLSVPPQTVKDYFERFNDYRLSSGKKYKSAKHTISLWIRTDIAKGVLKKELSPEELATSKGGKIYGN